MIFTSSWFVVMREEMMCCDCVLTGVKLCSIELRIGAVPSDLVRYSQSINLFSTNILQHNRACSVYRHPNLHHYS
jgi:hypothetical protein